jgi:hypothetical protein
MEQEFYASIKLISGEEIFSLVCPSYEEEDTFLILDNPVLIETIESRKGNIVGYKIKPWLNIPDDEMFIVNLNKVITMTEIKSNQIIKIYKRYLNQNLSVDMDRKMGFISKVDEARVFLENIYRTK